MNGPAALRRRIETRTARVCVIGQGYVGLSVATAAAAGGLRTIGVDVDKERVAALNMGRNVVAGVPDASFALGHGSGRLAFSTDFGAAADADVILICVPTPVVDHRPDLSFIENAARGVADAAQSAGLVILESTTYPGTTEQVVRPILERNGRRAGRDFLLAYSPERIDPGNVKYGLRNTPRIVGGLTPASTRTAAAFYRLLVDEVTELSSCRAAEMAKLLENTFRMVNIALVNELATLCSDQGIDVWEVISAAGTKPFGFMPFFPGPGVGGHCIPLDPTYLAWQSRRDTGKAFRLVETAQDVNSQMPTYVANRVVGTLNDRRLPVRGARILVLGVTYKADVGDLRESAAIEVMVRLARLGAKLSFHDPFIDRIDRQGLRLRRSAVTDRAIAAADAVLVLTPHSTYDLGAIASRASVLFDARNALSGKRFGGTVVAL